jgi:hypothetical protein
VISSRKSEKGGLSSLSGTAILNISRHTAFTFPGSVFHESQRLLKVGDAQKHVEPSLFHAREQLITGGVGPSCLCSNVPVNTVVQIDQAGWPSCDSRAEDAGLAARAFGPCLDSTGDRKPRQLARAERSRSAGLMDHQEIRDPFVTSR